LRIRAVAINLLRHGHSERYDIRDLSGCKLVKTPIRREFRKELLAR
jgi:hypothetical protein